MAIKVTKKDGGIIEITLNNGHAQALEKVTNDYQIVDEEKALGFILSVMRDAEGKAIQTASGSFVPAEQIKTKVTQETNGIKKP